MSNQPGIVVSSADYERLHALLAGMPDTQAVDRLIDELERAKVVSEGDLPQDVVKMHSHVTFTVLSTEKTFTYQLVYPHEAVSERTLSVLTPVGSALIGLSVGQEISWPLDGNRSTRVRIDTVSG